MRTSAFVVATLMALALAAQSAQARLFNDDAANELTLFSDGDVVMPEAVSTQRSLKHTAATVPTYCPNSNLPSQIVARVAILQFTKPGASTDANYGVRLYVRALYNIYKEQNRLFGTKLKYSVKNYQNPGRTTNPAQVGKSTQAWYYYYIVLDIGKCGTYKPGFISTLRNIIRKPRPGGTQVKVLRVINY